MTTQTPWATLPVCWAARGNGRPTTCRTEYLAQPGTHQLETTRGNLEADCAVGWREARPGFGFAVEEFNHLAGVGAVALVIEHCI